jgi:hypothetical protein
VDVLEFQRAAHDPRLLRGSRRGFVLPDERAAFRLVGDDNSVRSVLPG